MRLPAEVRGIATLRGVAGHRIDRHPWRAAIIEPPAMPAQTILTIATHGPGLTDFTDRAARFVAGNAGDGPAMLTLFVRHTSCSLTIQENADPDVTRDLEAFLHRLVPPSDDPAMAYLTHTTEGPDDMPAHIKAALTATSLTVPVVEGRMLLGTWQGVYLWEHRARGRRREVVLHLSG